MSRDSIKRVFSIQFYDVVNRFMKIKTILLLLEKHKQFKYIVLMKRENPLKCQKIFMMLFIVFTKKIMTKISFLLQHLATIRSMPRSDRSIDRNPSNRQGEPFCFDFIIIFLVILAVFWRF